MLNYLGQLRLYSLIDLFVFVIALGANRFESIGVILLHVGFLVFLETRHKHSYRKELPSYLWVVLSITGLILYGHIEGIAFVIFSYLYTQKIKKSFALFSPLMRGLQYFFLAAGVVGYSNNFVWIVFILIFIRNLCGDLRDTVKDKKENLKTLPVIIGLNKDIKYSHLALTLVTTFVWFQYTTLNPFLLIPIFIAQISVYNLTPR